MGPDPTDLVSLQEGNVETEATGRCHVRAEAEIGVTQLQAKNTEDRRLPPEARRGKEGCCLGPADTPISDSWSPER